MQKKAEEKNNVLESARKLLDARKDIIGFFEKGTFLYKDNLFKTKERWIRRRKSQKNYQIIENESKVLDHDLFKNCFDFLVASALAKKYIYII